MSRGDRGEWRRLLEAARREREQAKIFTPARALEVLRELMPGVAVYARNTHNAVSSCQVGILVREPAHGQLVDREVAVGRGASWDSAIRNLMRRKSEPRKPRKPRPGELEQLPLPLEVA